jgi:hypothetical protein
MQSRYWGMSLMFLLFAVAFAQPTGGNRVLVVNGRSGQAGVVQIEGRTYVDLETLVRIAEGSLSFQAGQITLTLPTAAGVPSETPPTVTQPDDSRLSRKFMVAGIETIAQMRVWASTLAYAIQNGYGVTENWVADYREQAAHSLNLATASVSTGADRTALQLLTNEFEAVRHWSNKLVEAKKSMDTAKYTVSPGALRDEPLSQKIISCGHFLAAMLGSGEINDDPSCH